MQEAAVVVFALAALGGVYLASRFFQGRDMPGAVAVIHGAAAATGLILLLLAVLDDAAGWATAALVVFLVAALGGFVLASYHLRGIRHPAALVGIHGLAAVSGFLLLLLAVFDV
jgi:hypothetical protein